MKTQLVIASFGFHQASSPVVPCILHSLLLSPSLQHFVLCSPCCLFMLTQAYAAFNVSAGFMGLLSETLIIILSSSVHLMSLLIATKNLCTLVENEFHFQSLKENHLNTMNK